MKDNNSKDIIDDMLDQLNQLDKLVKETSTDELKHHRRGINRKIRLVLECTDIPQKKLYELLASSMGIKVEEFFIETFDIEKCLLAEYALKKIMSKIKLK